MNLRYEMPFKASTKDNKTRNETLAKKKSSRFNASRIKSMDINFLTMESLILAQDERWRRASYMQVERESDFGQRKVADG